MSVYESISNPQCSMNTSPWSVTSFQWGELQILHAEGNGGTGFSHDRGRGHGALHSGRGVGRGQCFMATLTIFFIFHCCVSHSNTAVTFPISSHVIFFFLMTGSSGISVRGGCCRTGWVYFGWIVCLRTSAKECFPCRWILCSTQHQKKSKKIPIIFFFMLKCVFLSSLKNPNLKPIIYRGIEKHQLLMFY